MAAPILEQTRYWIVKPKAGTNQILNPSFAKPEGITGWYAAGTGVTLSLTGDHQRRGAYAMQVNCASGTGCTARTGSYLSVLQNFYHVLSMDVKAEVGQSMTLYIGNSSGTIKARKDWIATGYWQRMEVPWIATETATTYRAYITRNSSTSTAPYYVDGVQFENTAASSKATTYIEGYEPGCYWTGLPRQSSSTRSALTGLGGELICINDYAKITGEFGLGMGDWNQILTKMSSGGDLYQTHIRKSRNFTLELTYDGETQGELQAKRKVILDALRPDLLEDQERIIRYQGFDSAGQEATQPVDIHCVFLPSHSDTPETPVYQKDLLTFAIPSGLLHGAYNEGKALDLYADFPAEHIVMRNESGNWCTWNGSSYSSLITGLNGNVYVLAIAPNGDLYAGGNFTDAGGVAEADRIARWNGSTWSALGSGLNSAVSALAIAPNGDLYAGGSFTDAGGVTAADYVAKWDGSTWSALGAGLNNNAKTLAFAPNGDLYVGGNFTNAGGSADGDNIASWNGTVWSTVGNGLNGRVNTLAVAPNGDLYVGGLFTNAGGIAEANCAAVFSNGAWRAVDIDLPGAGEVYCFLAVSPSSDGINNKKTKYTLYFGGNFSTIGETPDENAKTGIVALDFNVNSASANTFPFMQIFGPGKLKSITNYSTGKSVIFNGLTLLAGEWIGLYFDPTNLRFVGGWSSRGNLMRYVTASSDYGNFYLQPGTNLLSLFMTDTTSASGATIVWQPMFWGLDGALL